jgi:outer membrane protein assembly factor BamE (lipoprotein component of BamABCDE complex)
MLIRRILLPSLLVMLAGCLVTSNSHVTRSGNYVPEATFDRIEPGKTSEGWVRATLGEPTLKTKVGNDNGEIWKWNYSEKKSGNGTLFLIFSGHNEDEKSHAAYVELKNGVVTKKWRA